MSRMRARLWFSSVATIVVVAACGPSDAEIKASVDSITRDTSAAAGAAGGGERDTTRAAADSAARRDTTPAKRP